jgi:hypothetical protein
LIVDQEQDILENETNSGREERQESAAMRWGLFCYPCKHAATPVLKKREKKHGEKRKRAEDAKRRKVGWWYNDPEWVGRIVESWDTVDLDSTFNVAGA